MKKNYLLLSLLLLSYVYSYAQSYEFGLVHNSGYNFKVVAIPDFTSTGNTDISDIGFTMVLPAGAVDITNQNSLLAGRTWSVQQFDTAFLTGQGLGDGTKDVFLFNNPPGQSLVSHNSGDQIDLVSFDITNMPTTGEIVFLLNSDPMAMGAGGVLDSFYNSNIDGSSTQDYFSGIASGQDSFMFSTLSVDEAVVASSKINIYPNPAKGIVKIQSPIGMTDISIEVFDNAGKQITMQLSPENTIDVSNIASGLYLITITSNDIKTTKKLIVE